VTRPEGGRAPSKRDEAEERPPSQADLFVQLVQSKGELFHDPEEDAYITLTDAGVTETLKLRSMRASAWMNRLYFELYGKVAGAQGRSDAINTLEGVALYGPRLAVHVRSAEVDGRLFIDLGDDSRDAVDVGPEGWRIVQRPPVRFVRPRGLLPLPHPVAGGRVDDLRPLVNVEDDAQFRLLVAWLVAAQRARGPFPILCVQGEHGSAKSTCSRFVRHLVDPKKPILRSLPRDERDLAVAARASHALAFDNLSGLPAWLSDALCRVATGGGFATRSLYTNDEETIFDFVRPVILNGIDDVASRADLADRCLTVTLPAIPKARRKSEKEILARFDDAAPGIYGAILTAVAAGLAHEHEVRIAERPRMADFAVFVTAAEAALGWGPGDFMAAYTSNQNEAVAMAIDADIVAKTVVRFMRERDVWSGEPAELHQALEELASERDRSQRGWPKAPNALSNRLRRLAPVLRESGIDVARGHDGRDDCKRRVVSLRRSPRNIVPTVPAGPEGGTTQDIFSATSFPSRPPDRPPQASVGPGTIAGTVDPPASSPPAKAFLPAGDDGDVGDDGFFPQEVEEPADTEPIRRVRYSELSPFQRELVDLGVDLPDIVVVRDEPEES
jgi:hypothetical protein